MTVIGGIPPFSFLWSTGDVTEDLTDLCAGDYSVTVTDSGNCSFEDIFILNDPTPLILNIPTTDASCFEECDGSAELIISGGTPPYTFIGQTDLLCAGTYTISIVDANGCEILQSFIILEPDEIVYIGCVDASNKILHHCSCRYLGVLSVPFGLRAAGPSSSCALFRPLTLTC